MSLCDPLVRSVLLTCVSDKNVRLYVVHTSDNPESLGIVYLSKELSCVIPIDGYIIAHLVLVRPKT